MLFPEDSEQVPGRGTDNTTDTDYTNLGCIKV